MANNPEQKDHDVLLSNIREVAKTKQGRELIWSFLEICDIYSISSSGDAFNEGRRDVGIQTLLLLDQADPDLYPNLMKEHSNNA